MPTHPVPINELSVAVQKAVEQALAKHGAVPVNKLWFGFVAPEKLANREVASEVTAQINKEAGIQAQAFVGQEISASSEHTATKPHAVQGPGHIIGLVYAPKAHQ